MTLQGPRWPWMGFAMVVLLLGGAALAACSPGGRTPTPAATPSRTPTPTPTPVPTVVLAPGFAELAGLNGLRCVGQWRDSTSGSSGAFSAKLEAGGGGGAITFEVGGNVFGGGAGGVFEAPFKLVGQALEINAQSTFLGHVEAHIGLDGKATGTLSGPPALGPKSQVTLTQYALGADRVLHFTLRVDPGDGRPVATSTVEAACSK